MEINTLERQTCLTAPIDRKGFSGVLANSEAIAIYEHVNVAESVNQLDDLARIVWTHWGRGELTDTEAEFLEAAIHGRRPVSSRARRAPGATAMKPIARLNARLGSRFKPRQRPRTPDREASRGRRRRLGGSSALPDTLRHYYTEGQRAVLCIISGEVKHHGICDLPIDKIGALAGVCRTTVQTTLHEARRLGHIKITERPVPGRKHLPNLITVASSEWKAWLKRGPSAHRVIGSKTVNLASTTKNTGLQKDRLSRAARPQGARQGDPIQMAGAPNELQRASHR